MSERDAFGRSPVVKYGEQSVATSISLSSSQGQSGRSEFDSNECQEYVCVSADYDAADHDLLLTPREAHRYTRYAVWLCSASLALSVMLGFAAITIGIRSHNDAAFGFGLNCGLDFFSTLVVLWRFSPKLTTRDSWQRERRASIGVALLFVLAFVVVMCKAIMDIVQRKRPASATASIVLACISILVCAVLAWAKFRLSGKLQSPSLRTDGVNTFCGMIIAIGVLVGWFVVQSHPDVWYVDSFVALLVGLGMFLYAVRVLAVMMSPEAMKAPIFKW